MMNATRVAEYRGGAKSFQSATHITTATATVAANDSVQFALGGEEGARLLRALGLSEAHGHPASPDTLLRRVRAKPDSEAPSPRVAGVDDWRFLRGRRYGAILVDLERH